MKPLGSFLVGLSALAPILSGRLTSRPLQYYCIVTSIHCFAQGLLLFSVPISSLIYGSEWYFARIAQLVFAVAYVIEIAESQQLKRGVSVFVMIGLVFGITQDPNVWFNWLAYLYGLVLTILGAMIVTAKDSAARTMAVYWIVMGCWNYLFLSLSGNPHSIIWSLNYWVPSALSVSAFITLSAFA